MFHLKDGVYFERTEGGGVRIFQEYGQPPGETPEKRLIVETDAAGWASVVASMSAEGENASSYQLALDRQLKSRPRLAN